MAKAAIVTVGRTVQQIQDAADSRKQAIQDTADTEKKAISTEVVLTLSQREAETLLKVCNCIGGSGVNTRRGDTNAIRVALLGVKVRSLGAVAVTGSITFHPEFTSPSPTSQPATNSRIGPCDHAARYCIFAGDGSGRCPWEPKGGVYGREAANLQSADNRFKSWA